MHLRNHSQCRRQPIDPKEAPSNYLMSKLFERAIFISKENEIWPDNCFTASTKESRRVAAICDVTSARAVLAKDYRAGLKYGSQVARMFLAS